MATTSGRSVGRPPHLHNQIQDYEPGDEIVGGWPLDRLLRMNDRFTERLEHAIACGLERPQKTDGEVRQRREQSTQLCDEDRVCSCGKAFHPGRRNQVYCSRRCYNARHR